MSIVHTPVASSLNISSSSKPLGADDLIEQYNVVSKNNIEEIESANIFLLGEIHWIEQCQKLNGLFISKLAAKSCSPVIVLLEGYPAMKRIEDIGSVLKYFNIKSSLDEKIQFFGWDLGFETGDHTPLLQAIISELDNRLITTIEKIKVLQPTSTKETISLPSESTDFSALITLSVKVPRLSS